MGLTWEPIVISVPMSVSMIQCDNPKCRMKFALLFLHQQVDDGYGEASWHYMNQEHPDYCPYCGQKQKESEE